MSALFAFLLLVLDVPWQAPDLTPMQRMWCDRFARDATAMTAASSEVAIEQMRRSAVDARAAELPLVAAYLERVALQAAGGDALETERALQASLHGAVIVLVRLRQPSSAESPFADISLGVRDRDDLWLFAFQRRLDAFEHSLPGYRRSWERESAPRGAHAIANLIAHAGTSAQSTAPAAYLPFDPALRAAAGRSVVHWKNMTVANWYARELRPVAEVLGAGRTSGESLSRWYALRFVVSDIGPKRVSGTSIRTLLGDQWAPLAVATQDILAVLADDHRDADLPTFVAVMFQTLNDTIRGVAPPQHRPAACLILNWCIAHGGLTAERSGWRIGKRALLRSLRALATELLEIEAGGDAARGAKMLATYGALTPSLNATLERLPPPNAPKAEVRFVPAEVTRRGEPARE